MPRLVAGGAHPSGKGVTERQRLSAHRAAEPDSDIVEHTNEDYSRTELLFRNHSTNLWMPPSIWVWGLYLSSRRAFAISANVCGTSPGCSGCRSICAVFAGSLCT